mmetsp:Transcript_65644/g.165415  ORF Transcript_65644/g.165415 Transcript_65644/m.165415 type:complete len:232 (-) Transcript_65644:172-867(-)
MPSMATITLSSSSSPPAAAEAFSNICNSLSIRPSSAGPCSQPLPLPAAGEAVSASLSSPSSSGCTGLWSPRSPPDIIRATTPASTSPPLPTPLPAAVARGAPACLSERPPSSRAEISTSTASSVGPSSHSGRARLRVRSHGGSVSPAIDEKENEVDLEMDFRPAAPSLVLYAASRGHGGAVSSDMAEVVGEAGATVCRNRGSKAKLMTSEMKDVRLFFFSGETDCTGSIVR